MMLTRREILAAPLLLSRTEAEVTPDLVRLGELEGLVRLIEKTPREECARAVVDQMRRGAGYRQLMGALFLAGVRNVNPRPPGFAMHCVFVIHSAHVLGLQAPADVRLLPLFYALDHFKTAQERDARAQGGDWSMGPLKGEVPSGDEAASELRAAMEAWDMDRAERAAAGMARNGSAAEAFALLWEYGARDYRNIGHKAIYVANASRTLDAIGWQHAEPVLRSLVLGLLDFGRQRQVNGYAWEDQCYHGNRKRVRTAKLPSGWARKEADDAATKAVVEAIRSAEPDEASGLAISLLASGKASAGAVWDAVHLAGSEVRMRAGSGSVIVGLHAVTSANALHYGWLAAGDASTRLLMLLQGVGWMGQFRKWAESREEKASAFRIEALEPAEKAGSVAEILTAKEQAAGQAMKRAGDAEARRELLAEVLRQTVVKANEVHYYKYQAALVEDMELVNERWRPHMVASTLYYTKGPEDAEPAPMKAAREALGVLRG
jgi:hypothetical protein